MALESLNLNKMTYDEVRGDLIASKKDYPNKKDQQQDEKKKTLAFKSTGEEEDDALDEDKLTLITEIVVDN